MTAARPGRASGGRGGSVVLLRRVEVDSPVHRLWAGTKLLAVAALSLTVVWVPYWPAIGVAAGLLLAAAVAARIPVSAVPRPPLWFWALIGAGGLLTLASGGRPELPVGGVHVGLGGLVSYAQFFAVGFEVLGAAALVGWTTDLGDVGPAVATLLRPLRWVRMPVEEWAVAVALCVRALPLIVGEVRVLLAVRRLRPRPRRPRRLDGYLEQLIEILVAALAVSLRRSVEMAEAMTARGGPGGVTARVASPGAADVVAGVVAAGACAAAWTLPH